ncbi:outer membrane protein transport protein [Flavobacterium sp. MFBS3-15]|uniref:OmpP1/FadL family transporter n=1 Tax=Flavobacterium sp. MFBS3-15 TaxID=2989816 RepID=UPI002235D298|nr:outer membrane protein transport protein [Flavobacterium sp. MFBS3-15]MCW4468467.1 outer membrane protein transport protein [Flavobacterium sp. MFBS3-15]
MKRVILSAAFILAAAATYAQQDLNTAADAVRYSTDNLTGSARFRAMSGAFGAVGGDLSSIGVNPAGAAVFNYNTGTASLSNYSTSNEANYFGTKATRNTNAFDLNQLGAVFVFTNSSEDAVMNKFTLGFNYENTNSYYNKTDAMGTNPTNSIDQYFLRYANGIGDEGGILLGTLRNAYFDELNFIDQQAYLGYNAYIFDPLTDNNDNTEYVSAVPNTGNYYHENYTSTRGYNGKMALNFATQLKQRFYLGANINFHFTDYVKTTSMYEDNNNPSATGLRAVRFDNERYTYGGGFSLNLGGIVKITEQLRAGVAYESPTWYRLQDEITQRISSFCPDCDANTSNDSFVTNPGITFVFDDYTIKTPSKWTGSLAYVFGKNGLVSVDYSIKDFSKTEYRNARYETINQELSDNMTVAGELRVGAEYRIKNFSLRGGYRFMESPYKDGRTMGDLTSYTGGLGYSFANSRIDLAYAWYQRKNDMPLLTAGFTDAARVTSTNNNVTISYTIDL